MVREKAQAGGLGRGPRLSRGKQTHLNRTLTLSMSILITQKQAIMGRGFVDQSALHPIPYKCWTGVDYHPLWQVVPALEPLYTDYEKSKSQGE